jgi:hypothetical protein
MARQPPSRPTPPVEPTVPTARSIVATPEVTEMTSYRPSRSLSPP